MLSKPLQNWLVFLCRGELRPGCPSLCTGTQSHYSAAGITPAGRPPHWGWALGFQPHTQRITVLLRWSTGSCPPEWTLEKGLVSLSSPGPGCLPGPPLKPRATGCRWEPLSLSWARFLILFNQTCCGREHSWKCPTAE